MSTRYEIPEQLDGMEGDWRIVSVSTPSSIFRDLQGMRGEGDTREGEDRRAGPSDPRSTEQVSLGRIGRLDLLQPLKQPGHDHGNRRIA